MKQEQHGAPVPEITPKMIEAAEKYCVGPDDDMDYKAEVYGLIFRAMLKASPYQLLP